MNAPGAEPADAGVRESEPSAPSSDAGSPPTESAPSEAPEAEVNPDAGISNDAAPQPETPTEPAAAPSEPETLDVLVVTGSRSERTRVETTVPVDVVSGEDLTRSGQNETARALSLIAPSFNSVPQTISDGSDHVAPASLRGLGPDQVLVLINGKRRHNSSLVHGNGTYGRGTVGTDLNAIPSSAIKRIEILRDGAATQYGTDAIAGVINIVLKNSTDVLDLTTSAGITGEGDGAQLRAATSGGLKLGEQGFLHVSAEFLQRGATERAGTYTGTIYSDEGENDEQILRERGLTRKDFRMRIGESAATMGTLFYNMELPLNEHATLYSFGGITHREGRAAGFYRFPKQVAQVVSELYPNGFLPEIRTRIDDLSSSVGVRSRVNQWDVDLSLTHGRNDFVYNVENSNNASLGTASPTSFGAGGFALTQTVADFDLLREIDTGVLDSLAFIAGSEFRLDRYEIFAGEEASYVQGPVTFGDPPRPKVPGSQVFPGFEPSNTVDRTRYNIGAYVGFESALTRWLTLDLGGRFEHYSDFGRAVIGKGAARVQLFRGVALRGALSTGFRAPSLQQLWFNNVSTLFSINAQSNMLEVSQVLTSNNRSPVTRAFGIPDLKQETALNASAGLTLQPLEQLSLTLDGYYIKVDDRVVLTNRFVSTDPDVAELLAPFEGVGEAQFFANAVDTSTRGIDIVADYTLNLQPSTFIFTAAANLSWTEVTRVNLPSELLGRAAGSDSTLRESFFGRQERGRLEEAVPHERIITSIRYRFGHLSALIRASYYGAVTYRADNPDNDEEFGGKFLFDTEVSYRFHPALLLALGADNIFNTFPDRQKKEANISAGRFLYNRNVNQFGMNGGFYYARLQVSWL